MSTIAYTIAGDALNLRYAKMMEKSFHHFNPDIELVIYGPEEMEKIKDPNKFYKGTPLFARELLKDHDLVIKIDADTLFLGSIQHIIDNPMYDVGSVCNINRVDPQRYGMVSIQGVGPQEYVNCGFVAMRSKEFVDRWWDLCNSKFFDRFRYREQDLLNILFHFGGYKAINFDFSYPMWHGLVAKGEGIHAVLRDGKVFIPKGEDKYPDKDTQLIAYHFAGGQGEPKMDYQKVFPEEVIEFIDGILK